MKVQKLVKNQVFRGIAASSSSNLWALGIVMSLVGLTAGITGCGSSSSKSKADGAPVVTNDEEALNKRLKLVNQPVALTDFNFTGKTKDFSLTLVGELDPPTHGDHTLQATDVHVSGSKIYLSYNVAGAVQKGAIEIIDGSKPDAPRIKSQVIFPERDVNALHYRSSNVYITGALSEGSSDPAPKGGYAAVLSASGFSFNLDGIVYQSVPSYAGTDVYFDGKSAYVTSGDSGGLSELDSKTLLSKNYWPIFDARAVAADSKSRMVLTGQPAKVVSFDGNGPTNTFDIGGATIPQSKSTITLGKKTSLISVGEDGWKVICNATGATVTHVPAITIAGKDSKLTVTNAVSESYGLIFAANGEAGVYVYSIDEKGKGDCDGYDATLQGQFDAGKGESANHVYARHNYVFVATGKGGLKILSLDNKSYTGHDDDKVFKSDDDDEDDDDDKDDKDDKDKK